MKNVSGSSFYAAITKSQSRDSGMAAVLILLLTGLIAKDDLYFKIAAGALAVDMLFPWFYYPFAIFWFGLSRVLGSVVSRVLLTAVYLVVVLPVALARQMAGKDPLMLKGFKKERGSVMKVRNHLFTPEDLEKPF